MARIPTLIWVAAGSQLVPLLAGGWRWRTIRGPRLWLMVWLALLIAMDAGLLVWSYGLGRGNNHVVSYFFMPFQSAAVLWALGAWQVRPLLRMTARLSLPVLLLWWALCIAFFEDYANFSVLGSPVYSVVALAAAVAALVTRAADTDEPVLAQDWCWFLGGLSVFFATNATVTIVQSVAQSAENWDLLLRALTLKAGIDILAMSALTVGFLCPAPTDSSGTFSWSDLSPPPSSLWR